MKIRRLEFMSQRSANTDCRASLVRAAAFLAALLFCVRGVHPATAAETRVDFNRDVRRILSENCFNCHGPDAPARKGGRKTLRLDLPESAMADLGGGHRAIVPGQPARSELVRRITAEDPDEVMPPPDTGKRLTASEIVVLRKWIEQGAPYSRHWAYVPPIRPAVPQLRGKSRSHNGVDSFIRARLERERLKPSREADRATLIRRVSLDLTGLPPTLDELDQFLADRESGAYERLVDQLLEKKSFGEHWARLWLDLARYADSSGYADDPARTIWAYRDYVIRSLNANKPFDQFTIEQLAGDLLEDPTDEQLVATAFHRNTMTNNEGGTSDEEYRNVAIVDRVNTTMAVWMGTTMACAQCHNHKYDPISQEDYFRMFAVLNNTADADRFDESPVLPLYTPDQKKLRRELQAEIASLENVVGTSTPALAAAQARWEKNFETDLSWRTIQPTRTSSAAGAGIDSIDDGTIRFARGGKTDTYRFDFPAGIAESFTGLRLEVLPDETLNRPAVGHGDGNFVVSRVLASVAPSGNPPVVGRYLRIALPGQDKILSLAEVQIFSAGSNVALRGEARQSSTAFDGPARFAIDGNTDGRYDQSRTTTHTGKSNDPWWEVDLRSPLPIERVVIWNRTDASPERLNGFQVQLLDEQRGTVWRLADQPAPSPSAALHPDGARPVVFTAAGADFSQKDFNAADLLGNKDPKARGWAIAPQHDKPHHLMLTPDGPVAIGSGSNLVISVEQLSKFEHATIARLRWSVTADPRAREFVRVPASTLAILRKPRSDRTAGQQREVQKYYLSIAPGLAAERTQLAELTKRLESEKPYTTVPILRDLASDKRRKTHLQRRGNFMDLGPELNAGLPATFTPGATPSRMDRLALARWLVDRTNPLTARVMVNRLWESVFGIGLVRTSEEFGAQGELPSHPELLDWLAVELMESGWDTKHLLRLLVTSSTYRQSSRVTPDLLARDPENRLLARGPRFRISAEMVRDQALAVSGLLSVKMHGPPVKPPQPKLGLSAAFGSATDWETSTGEDRHRRAIYTTWRRSNPYPSMVTFDAPNREVCLVRRERSNTPLQALVTLNDPVYVEAAQALAHRMARHDGTPEDKARHGFRICLSRPPTRAELRSLVALYESMLTRFQNDSDKARAAAVGTPGDAPKDIDLPALAAWTVVGNVLLNLDEMFMKR